MVSWESMISYLSGLLIELTDLKSPVIIQPYEDDSPDKITMVVTSAGLKPV